MLRALFFATSLLLAPAPSLVAQQAPVPADSSPVIGVQGGAETSDTLAVRPPPALEPSSPTAALDGPGGTLLPLDLRIAQRARTEEYQMNPVVRSVAAVMRSAALPGTLLLAGALYGSGHLADRPALADLGLQAGQAVVASGVTSLAIKIAVGRARPHAAPADPRDLSFGRGLQGDRYQSFPSAHTAAAFAAAAVFSHDFADRSGGSPFVLIPLTYAGATLAGISRIYHDEHWATDIIGGALVGSIAGFAVIQLHGH